MADIDQSKAQLLRELADQRDSEEKWRSLAENAPIFILMVNRAGEIQFLNRTQPGYSIEESIGKPIFDFIEPEYHDLVRDSLERVFATGDTVSYEMLAAGPGGRKAWYETNVGPIKNGQEIVSVSHISADITARKEAEASLQEAYDTLEQRVEERASEVVSANERLQREIESRRQSEERYRLLVETTNDLIWEVNQTGEYTYVSPNANELLGYEPEEMIGKTPFEFMSSTEAERVRPMFDECVRSGKGVNRLEIMRVHKNGQLRLHETSNSPILDATGTCCGFRGISRDVTERRKAEEAIRDRHEELRAIYDGMVDGVLIADIETKRFVRANSAICQMLGYTEEEILSLTVMDIHPHDDLAEILEVFEVQAEGRLKVAVNLPMLRKDGSVFYADITTNQLDYQGRRCNIGFFRDITERRESEEALQKEHRALNHLLKAQDRERQITVYEIHDGLAQKLTAAIMQFQMFDRIRYEVSEEASRAGIVVRELLDQSLAEARHLINGMRPPILDECGVVPAIEHLICDSGDRTCMAMSFHDNVEFDRLEPVLENAIYRIAQESLSNACCHSKSDRVRIDLVQHNQRVQLTVRDWGIGFDPHYVDEQCFGLAGIRERARLLGGHVQVDSELGEGSCIVVELPLALDELDG